MQDAASDTKTLAEKLRAMGVSESYASQLVNDRRKPSMPLALRIYREIGAKMGPLAGVADEDIPALERAHAAASGAAA